LDVGHVAQNGKDQHTSGQTSAGVDHTSDQSISETIVIKLVVGTEGGKSSGANAISKEDLGGCIYPSLPIFEITPIHVDIGCEAS